MSDLDWDMPDPDLEYITPDQCWDLGCLSWTRIFSIPDPWSKRLQIPIFLTQKLFLSSRKYDPGCSSRIPDPDPDFLPIPDPGVKKAPDP